jgi:hypothetical protein
LPPLSARELAPDGFRRDSRLSRGDGSKLRDAERWQATTLQRGSVLTEWVLGLGLGRSARLGGGTAGGREIRRGPGGQTAERQREVSSDRRRRQGHRAGVHRGADAAWAIVRGDHGRADDRPIWARSHGHAPRTVISRPASRRVRVRQAKGHERPHVGERQDCAQQSPAAPKGSPGLLRRQNEPPPPGNGCSGIQAFRRSGVRARSAHPCHRTRYPASGSPRFHWDLWNPVPCRFVGRRGNPLEGFRRSGVQAFKPKGPEKSWTGLTLTLPILNA